jgi:hypothetical protein
MTTTENATMLMSALGRISRNMIRQWLAPMARAASTNSRLLWATTLPLVILANDGMIRTARLRVRLGRLGRSAAARAMRNNSGGNACTTSASVSMTASIRPRKYPASSPRKPPTTSPTTAAASPTAIDALAPYTMRESTLRPIASVPSGSPVSCGFCIGAPTTSS